jgi:predicted 3-demethylubiquinone-9 3-methyltransferase (glyoxalase superfamily)
LRPKKDQGLDEPRLRTHVVALATTLRATSGGAVSSSPKVSTTLWFDKDAEAAAQHYTKAIPGSEILGIEHYGKAGPGPEGSVMLVRFRLGGQEFMALNGGPLFTPNEAVSFVIYCDDQAEVDRLWNHMSEGGQTSHCGWLKDRWGFSWQIVPRRFIELMTSATSDEAKARVFSAMMHMTKFEIAKLERAA